MHHHRLRPGTAGMRRAIGLAFLVAIGCSPAEELTPDPGVSPFYPGPSAGKKATPGSLIGGSATDRASARVATEAEGPIRPEDVERQLRVAMRAGEKGDMARAVSLLDRILAVEPLNREALFGRAAAALTQAQRATSPDERRAAIDKAAALVKTLQRSYERANPRELELASRINFEQVHTYVSQGQLDRAVAVLKEVYDARFDPFDVVEADPELGKLRASKGYQDLLRSVKADKLARAKSRAAEELARTPNFKFEFNVNDLDGKPLSLDQFKGKVLLVDIWGTWCKPCRDTIPGLIQLYKKHKARGFEIIGLDHEQESSDPELTRQMVKKFVQDAGIPYPIAPFDETLRDRIPGFQAYPTTLIIDRTGKVRIFLTGGGPEAVATMDAAVEVLLAESETKGADAKGAAKPGPDTKAGTRTSSPPPAEAKGTPRPR